MCSNPPVKGVIPKPPTSSLCSRHGDAKWLIKSSKLCLVATVGRHCIISFLHFNLSGCLQGQGTTVPMEQGSAYISKPIPGGGSYVFILLLELLNSRAENNYGWPVGAKAAGKHPPYNILFGYRRHNIDNKHCLIHVPVNEKTGTSWCKKDVYLHDLHIASTVSTILLMRQPKCNNYFSAFSGLAFF